MNGSTIHFDELKSLAGGRWAEILPALTSLPPAVLTKGPSDHPCPKCGGRSTIWPAEDAQQTGRVACRNCTSDKPTGDGIATVAAFNSIPQIEAARAVADYLGLDTSKPRSTTQQVDLIDAVCRAKRMPREAFEKFGVTVSERGRDRKKVVRVDAYDASGRVHSYFDLEVNGKGKFKPGRGSAGMFFPSKLPKPGECWLLVEGAKDAAALVGLGFNAAGMPTSYLDAKYSKLFTEVDVVLVPDLDTAGQRGAQRTGGNLSGIAASVHVARLPGEVVERSGADVRDVIHAHGADAVRDAIQSAKLWEPRDNNDDDNRPEVLIGLCERSVADQVVKCLGRLGWETDWIPEESRESVKVYQRSGLLVDAVRSEDPATRGKLTIRTLPPCILRERITEAVKLTIEKAAGGEVQVVPTRPPKWLIESVHNRGSFGDAIRPLVGVVESPTLRADGTVLQEPGYDAQTGLIFRPSDNFPKVPETPSKADAVAAIAELLEVVADFPFQDDADRSAWVCLVLSSIGRECIPGGVPLFAVTANIRGAGKSLLVDSASRIAFGRSAARKAFTRDDDEMRKAITAIALEGAPAVLFDNLDQQLGGASLDAALTGESWTDRILGSSRMTGDLPMRTVWSATGNNLDFGSDVARRVLPIRLQSPHESPEDRNDFRHSDLLGFVSENRPRLAVAALTVLRAYFHAGCPLQPGGEWGSFEAWSRVVRGSLVWAGTADPLPTRIYAASADDAKTVLGLLITGIEEADPAGKGLTVKEIERLTTHRVDEVPTCPTLIAALGEICGARFNPKRLGRKLKSFTGRNWQGRKLVSESARGGVQRWRVRAVEPPSGESGGFGGFGGFGQPDLYAGSVVFSHAQESCDLHDAKAGMGETNQSNQPNQPSPRWEMEL